MSRPIYLRYLRRHLLVSIRLKSTTAHQICYLTMSRTQANETPVKIENQPASLAVEAAVAIVINGIHYAVLMASPHQLEYLALGFLYSEGLIQHGHDLLDWEVTQLQMTPATSYLPKLQTPMTPI